LCFEELICNRLYSWRKVLLNSSCKVKGTTLSAPCPCAFTSSPSLVSSVLYGGKCYLFYETNGWISWTDADTNCQSPTTNVCDGKGHKCINSTTGVGRLATFNNWTDYITVTSQFNAPSADVIVGLQCSSGGQLSNYDPYGYCNPPATISGNPGCTYGGSGNPDVIIGNPWNAGFAGNSPSSGSNAGAYICEAGKILQMLFSQTFNQSNPRTFRMHIWKRNFNRVRTRASKLDCAQKTLDMDSK